MYTAITIADEILKIAKRNDTALTPMQLVKLVYIAHGFALAILNRDLFKDRIEAWKYGPVIPELYHATKQYGRNPIPASKIKDEEPSVVDKETRALLEDVFAKYGHLSAFALSNLTHRPGSPWDLVYRDGYMNIEIPDDIIRQHYREKLDAHASTAARER